MGKWELNRELKRFMRDAGVAPVAEDVLIYQGDAVEWAPLDGLADLDQYLLLAGRTGGQIAYGGDAANDDLTLRSTAHATKGTVFILDDDGILSIGSGPGIYMEAGANVNALYVDADGHVGFGADPTAAYDLQGYIASGNYDAEFVSGDANVRLGFDAAGSRWVIENTGTQLEFEDVTGGAIPVVFEDGAGNNTLVVDTNSRVGVGTAVPTTKLEVYDSAAAVYITVQNAQVNSIAAIQMANDAQSWSFQCEADDTFRVTDLTGGATPFIIAAGAAANSIFVDAAGRVGVGAPPTNVSNRLEISTTIGALVLPRMTTAQRNALTAVDGMLIYNTTTAIVEAREGGAWVNV